MNTVYCPKCHSQNITRKNDEYVCDDCGYTAKPMDEIEAKLMETAENVK